MRRVQVALTVAVAVSLAVPPVAVLGAPTGQIRLRVDTAAPLLPLLKVQDGCEGECPPYEPPRVPEVDRDREPPGLSGPGTRRIEWLIQDRIRHCEEYRPIWRIDCLADGFKQIARSLPDGKGYSTVRDELSKTADELALLARKNADPTVPAERLTAQTSAGPRRTSRPLVAVAPQNLPAANAQADTVIAELSTTLLRSSPDTALQPEIARIAAAVDSTRILLRSS